MVFRSSASFPPRFKRILLLVIVLVAAFLRLVRIRSLPPAGGYDPAWYGVDALRILDGELPVFLPTNFGREVLFSYIVALSVAVLGIGPLAIHVASSAVGVATIPAVYWAAEEVFADSEDALRRYGGLFASGMMAVSYWHVNWSRYGVRAITVPLLATLTMAALLRALRSDSTVWLAVGGMLLGLSLYTYQSARLLPALVVFAIGVCGREKRKRWHTIVRQGAIVVLVSLMVFAPMGFYFLTHPADGMERIEQVFVVEPERGIVDNAGRIWSEIVDALQVLFIHGDEESIHNLVGRPAMNPFLGILFLLGLVIAVGRIRRPSAVVPLAWILLMSLPVVLSLGGQPTKRALGALPAIAMVTATGVLVPWSAFDRWVETRNTATRRVNAVLLAIVALGFVVSGILTYRDYVLIWGRDADLLFTNFKAGHAAIGAYVRTLPEGEDVYISPELPDHPSIVFNSEGRPDMKGYNGRACIVVPARTSAPTTYMIVPDEDPNSLPWLRQVFPMGQVVAEGPLHYQTPHFLAYHIDQGAHAQIQVTNPVSATWSGRIELLGYALSPETPRPGQTVDVVLTMRALAGVDTDYVLFTHLLGPTNPANGGPLWAQDDSEPCRSFYPTSTWDPGEIVRDTYRLTIPADAPSATYDLQMGFYAWPEIARLPVDQTGDLAQTLAQIRIGERAP